MTARGLAQAVSSAARQRLNCCRDNKGARPAVLGTGNQRSAESKLQLLAMDQGPAEAPPPQQQRRLC